MSLPEDACIHVERTSEPQLVTAAKVAKVSEEAGIGVQNLSGEFMVVIQEMVKNEVGSYMEERNGMCFSWCGQTHKCFF